MGRELELKFDPQRCLECWACEIACRQWHQIPPASTKPIAVSEVVAGVFPRVSRAFVARFCRHCREPACLAACPSGAISKHSGNGIVALDWQKCDGCQACLAACPWDVPEFRSDGKMQKCDLCAERLEANLPPVCVATCPTRALSWGEKPAA